MLAVDVDTRGELRPGEPTVLFDQCVMIEGSEQADGFELYVVVNWADELDARIASR